MTASERKAEAAKARKAAEAAERAAAAEEEKEKRVKTAEVQLSQDAKVINTRLKKADKLAADADDHRLAAALTLADAKDHAKAAGIPFKTWCEESIEGRSYETVRKLVPIGVAERDEKGAGALLLEDMRTGEKKRKSKSRETVRQTSGSTGSKATGGTSTDGTESGPGEGKYYTLAFAKSVFDNMREKDQETFAQWVAERNPIPEADAANDDNADDGGEGNEEETPKKRATRRKRAA